MLLDFIPKGKENAISRKELAQILSLPERTLRQLIEQQRNEGQIICSNWQGKHRGYYQPATEAEKQEFLNGYKSYIKKMFKTYENMKKSTNQTCKSETLW